MGMIFEDEAFDHLMYWVREDRKAAKKVHSLIKDIQRNGCAQGMGHPERLGLEPSYRPCQSPCL